MDAPPPFDAPFRDLLDYHMARRVVGSDAALAASFNRRFPDQRRQPLSRQTIRNWTGPAGRVPQTIDDILKLAWVFALSKAEASQLLRAAGRPWVDALLDASRTPLGWDPHAREEQAQLRALLQPWTAAAPNNLPEPTTRLIGRDDEVLRVALPLGRDARLVTLTGPGGSGKTRLALAVARLLLDSFPEGVRLVPLEDVAAPDAFLPTLARALDVPLRHGDPPLERLAAHLRDRAVLLVLDNFEQLLDAAPQLGHLLRAAPALRALVTSREPLRLGGERAWPVLPLPLPGGELQLRSLRANPAIALFVERAAAARPDFALTRRNAVTVAMFCARLDGLPLAIELAAARVREAPPAELLARYASTLDLAGDGPRDSPHRQQSLRRTIAWSEDLLTAPRRTLFRRLAVFAGGFTAKAMAAVCGGGDTLDDDLEALRAAGLVAREPGGTERFAMLNTIRAYAAERLAGGDEWRALGRRHFDWCLALAHRAESHLEHGAQQKYWLRRLDEEYANLRAACAWAEAHDPERGIELAGALAHYWLIRRNQAEGRAVLERLLRGTSAPTLARARALYGLGYLLAHQRLDLARRHLAEALDIARALGDAALGDLILPVLIFVAQLSGDHAAIPALMGEAARSLGDRDDARLAGMLTLMQGYEAEQGGRLGEAKVLLDRAVELGRETDFPLLSCMALSRLGHVKVFAGELAAAAADFEALLALADGIGAEQYRLLALHRRGLVAEAEGRLDDARGAYLRAADGATGVQEHLILALARAGLGRVALREGQDRRATALLEEGLRLAELMEDRRNRGEILRFLWLAHWRQGRRREAAATLRAALGFWREAGHRRVLLDLVELLATTIARDGECAVAASWFGASEALRDRLAARLPVDEAPRAGAIATCRDTLGRGEFHAHWKRGRALGLDGLLGEVSAWVERRLAREADGPLPPSR